MIELLINSFVVKMLLSVTRQVKWCQAWEDVFLTREAFKTAQKINI
jgi:hypothetical protein